MQATINTLDFETIYGVTFLNGLKDMEQPAPMKEAESYDWPERDGREYFMSGKVEDYDVSLDVVQVGADMSEFLARKAALVGVLQSPIFHAIYVASTGVSYSTKYKSITSYQHLTGLVGQVGAKYTINLTVLTGGQVAPLFILDGNGN